MLKCLIVDDEQAAIDVIADYINLVPFLECVATTTDVISALEILNNENIDLVFSDIQMPYMTGIDFVKALEGKCKVIFTTAYAQFALEGYNLDVIDYLLKPISFPRFLKSANKAKVVLENENPRVVETQGSKFILLKGNTKSSYVKVNTADIDFIESGGNYITVVCGKRKIVAHTKISSIEALLPTKIFFRVQKSFIVNVDKIESIKGNTIQLTDNTQKEILIGNTYKDPFMKFLNDRIAGP